jgi:hypothetical protein
MNCGSTSASCTRRSIHCREAGCFRRKYRRDRRPTLPTESRLRFYSHFVADLLYKHVKMAQLAWRFHRFKERLKRDAASTRYTDVALTPDTETDMGALEIMLTHITPVAASAPVAVSAASEIHQHTSPDAA